MPRDRACRLWLLAALLPCVLAVPGASAQETRAEAITQDKNQKAAALTEYRPGVFEKALNFVQEEASAPPIGFYPFVDSIYTSSLVSLGVGYRKPFGDTGAVVLDGAYSLRGFWRTRGRVTLPKFADERMTVELRGFVLDASKVRFYGIGDDSSADDLSHYAFRGTDLLAELRVEPVRRLLVGAHVAYDAIDTRGGGGGAPSIDQVFTPDEAPGLDTDPEFVRVRAFAEYDWRTARGYTRRGGLLRAQVTRFDERTDLPFDFTRFDLAATQHIPVYRENWVLAFRGLLSTTSTADGQEIPYFLLPALGESSDELRGFPALRFRDRNRMLLTAEYRWLPSHYIDLALFVDAGKVAPRAGDLDFDGLESAWGLSVRLHTPKDTVMHLSAAHSGEGWRFVFGTGPVF